MRSIKLAFRTLFKTPFITAIAILSLALGIGANAAIFSMFDQMLLQPLPVRAPTELVNLSAPGPKPGSQSCSQAGDCETVFSYPMYRDLEKTQTAFAGIAAHRGFGTNVSYHNQSVSTEGMMVTGSYFPLLGVRPALGRLLGPSDDDKIGGNFVVVLSYSYWASSLGSDPSVLNQTITVNGQSMTIVGVTAKDFEGTTLGSQPHLFVPISMRGLMESWFKGFDNRRSYWMYVFGRLKAGGTVEQAAKAINATYRPIVNDIEAPLQKGMSDATMAKFRAKSIVVEPGKQGQSSIHREAKKPLLVLFATTGVVLLIACANIANLLLARGANRSMEMAVRLALGATRRQLLTQLLTESVLLASLGGAASLVVAKWTLASIAAMLPPDASSSLHFSLQPSVILFAAGMSIATGLLFGMFPALNSTRPDLVTTIRSNAGQILGARAAARFRSTLVTVQIAMSMALLITAGLFIRSLVNVSNVDLGLRIDNVVTFSISPELSGYDSTRSQVLFTRAADELASLPGVTGVTQGIVGLLSGSNWGTDVAVQGFQSGPDINSNSNYNEVGEGYFSMLSMPLIAGREFTLADSKGSAKVAVVNEAFVKKFHLGNDAVGKFIGINSGDSLNTQIVGVVKNAKYSAVKKVVPPLFFTPWKQDGRVGSINFYVRTSQSLDQVVRAIPGVMKRIDPNLPIENLKTMPQQVKENVGIDRMISILSAAFAVLATLLAGIGLYGVLAYTVAQRTREIGVRMALGANAGRVRVMVMRQVGVMMAIGGVVGIIGAVGIGRAAGSLLFELSGSDPLVYTLAAAMLVTVAMFAGFLPAQRAARVDPMQALRYE